MMLEQAKQLSYHQVLHFQEVPSFQVSKCKRWRVNGKIKLWKRSPERIQIPLIHGLQRHGYLTEKNVELFHLEISCGTQLD